MTDHLEAASESIRQHLHDRPWDTEPHRVYGAIADLQDITRRLTEVLDRADRRVLLCLSSDDGRPSGHVLSASDALRHAQDLLAQVTADLGAAQSSASHLIWTVPS